MQRGVPRTAPPDAADVRFIPINESNLRSGENRLARSLL
jgi:hypothetical protein